MKRLLFVRLIPVICAVTLCGCMTTPGPGSNGNSNGNSNTNTNNNSSGGSKFTLSVSVVNAEGPSEGPRVQIFAGDRAIDRLEMTTVARLFELAGSEERGLTQRDLQIDAGMVVTLIALESRGVSTSRLTNTELSDFRSIDNAEFVNFIPDSMAGITFSESEQSVMSFTMDRDISVVANFRQMPSIRVALQGDQVIDFGLLSVDLEAPKWLSEPTQLSDGTFICDAGNVGADPPDTGTPPPPLLDGFVYLAQVKSGTMFTFTAVDLDGSGYTFDRWSANTNNCGGGRTCLLTLGSGDQEITGIWVRP